MNFGKPSLQIREPYDSHSEDEVVRQLAAQRLVTVRGEWWLWIYCCNWRLTSDSLSLAMRSSSFRQIQRALAQLEGQKLVTVEVEPATGATSFTFDLGCALHCRRFKRDSEEELWTLYKPSGYAWSVYGNGTFSHQRSAGAGGRLQPIEVSFRSGTE
jgi:hypothetical protein